MDYAEEVDEEAALAAAEMAPDEIITHTLRQNGYDYTVTIARYSGGWAGTVARDGRDISLIVSRDGRDISLLPTWFYPLTWEGQGFPACNCSPDPKAEARRWANKMWAKIRQSGRTGR
jgi:hypothetical protein